MPIFVPKGKEQVDLLKINEENLYLLNTFTDDERFDAVQYLLDHYMDLEVHNVIERLAKISFKLNGIHFLSHCSFLAELIREYVDKYHGMRITMTYAARKESGLKHYKFSLHSTYIFNELFTIVESSSSNEPEYVAIFARSLARNIWLPILSSRSRNLTFSPLTSEQSEPLVNSIFRNNLNLEEAYVTCFDTSLHSLNKIIWSIQ